MANCPKCGYKLRMIDIKAECPKCGVNLLYYNQQERLALDADKAEEEHINFQPKIDRVKFHSTVAEVNIGGVRVLLMKPTTLMNNSGVAIGEAASFYKIPAERVLILHDEISFDPGALRIRRKGSAGGHNGLKSIIANLGSDKFTRIRIGIGQKPHPAYELAAWVLSRFTESDRKAIDSSLDRVCDTVELLIAGKDDEAMRLCNSN